MTTCCQVLLISNIETLYLHLLHILEKDSVIEVTSATLVPLLSDVPV